MKKHVLDTTQKKQHSWLQMSCQDALLSRDILEGRTKGKLTRNRKRLHIINDIVVKKHIRNSQKREAGERLTWAS